MKQFVSIPIPKVVLSLALLALQCAGALAQSNTMTIHLKDGQVATYTVEDIDSVTFPTTLPSYLACPDGNHPHAIDLGLPSGTKWACCNVGAASPSEYGGYYAWGETEQKETFSAANCLAYVDSRWVYYGTDISGTQYDVAHMVWGDSWLLPTYEQYEELGNGNYCTWTWKKATESDQGLAGYEVKGKNGGTIFMPAAGCIWGDKIYFAGASSRYWTSTLTEAYEGNAYGYYFDADGHYMLYYGRSLGQSARAVTW